MVDAVRLFMGEGDATDTIPIHKTEIKSSEKKKKKTLSFILMSILIANSQR